MGTQWVLFSYHQFLLAHEVGQSQAWTEGAPVPGTSVRRGAQEAQCWQPAPFPQLCDGILPASPSPRASLWPLAVPVSADSRRTKCESPRQHQVSAAALGPAGPDWISNWITVPASENVSGSATQCWLSPPSAAGDCDASGSSLLGPHFVNGETEAPRGDGFPWGHTDTQ